MSSVPPLRKLQYVLAVAHELHFRKAAEHLNVSQPSMSRQIRELEAELGFDIFHRDHHFVALTEPGRAFVAAAEEIMERLEQDFTKAVDVARAIHHRNAQEFTIGHSPYISPKLRLRIRRIQRSLFPSLQLRFRSMFPADLSPALESCWVQAGLTFEPLNRDEIGKITLWPERLCAVTPRKSTLSPRPYLMLSDLRDLPLICTYSARTHPMLCQWMLAQYARVGFEPHAVEDVNSPQEAFDLVQANVGIAVLPHSSCFNMPPTLRSVPIHDAEPMTLALVYHPNCTEQTQHIVHQIGELLRRKQGESAD
jgi:DNA-binding transcriptional LysR family regulator